MALLDALGQRWTLRLLWELGHGSATFRVLRTRCEDVSPTLLNKRLKELRALALIELGDNGFALTSLGIALVGKLASLDSWANDWADQLERRRQLDESNTQRNPMSSMG